jgi:hypothetical protein
VSSCSEVEAEVEFTGVAEKVGDVDKFRCSPLMYGFADDWMREAGSSNWPLVDVEKTVPSGVEVRQISMSLQGIW